MQQVIDHLGVFSPWLGIFSGIAGDFVTVVFDNGKALSMFGSTVASTAFGNRSCMQFFLAHAPMTLFTAMLLWSHKTLNLTNAEIANASVEWFNPYAPGVNISRAKNPITVMVSLAVWWLYEERRKELNGSRGPNVSPQPFTRIDTS